MALVTDSRRATDDGFLTRREAQLLHTAETAAEKAAQEAHEKEHDAQRLAMETALEVTNRDRQTHELAHDREHDLHEAKHKSESTAVETALSAVARERQIHADAHERDHLAHQREHGLANLAIEKAERATDLRFNAANAFREQLNDVIRTLATKDSFDTFQKDANRRFDEMRVAITNLEKGDVKSEGRGVGQAATIAAIVTAISVIAALLGITIVLSNALT